MATNISQLRRTLWRGGLALERTCTTHRVHLAVVTCPRMALRTVRREALKDAIYLAPVRVFIGIGWLRAFADKALEPGWRDGTRLVAFLERQLDAGMVVFPPYQVLLSEVFLAHAVVLGWIVMLGQLLAGMAIASGSLTTAALLGGIFMNLNFLLAGAPDPSTFYIIIQGMLLSAGAGTILGADAWLAARIRSPFLAARPPRLQSVPSNATPTAVALAMLALGCAVYATVHIRDWTPGGSVHDPATVLAVLAAMAASWAIIVALRGGHQPPAA